MSRAADAPIVPDRFQREALDHLDGGRSVLVAAPTGSGKTFIAEHAIDRAIAAGHRAFYTTPIKALSNQKYRDLSSRIGASRVGLLTGDNVINGDADVVVMTTEVLRNMLYARSEGLARLGVVVLDEIHFLEDRYRGPVWEEVILHLDTDVTLVCLSATVSNADEVGGWLTSVRGDTAVVVETTRPVELVNLYAVGDRRGNRLHIVPTLLDGRPNPEGDRYDPETPGRRAPNRRHKPRPPWRTPQRTEILDRLDDRGMLPVIWFVFSRKGCDEAARSLIQAGVQFTTPVEREAIRHIASQRLDALEPADRKLLDGDHWLDGLERGVAAHHAGLVPAFKEAVEECFAEGLLRVVFATETLALGVNLPARSVVIDRLTKFTGEGHDMLTPAQYTQLTGRAGRRGIDDVGHAVVPWSPFINFDQLSSLAGSSAFRLRSAFRPTYNMVANLLARHDPESARQLLARSFAQYQADAGVVRLEQRLTRERARIDDLRREVDLVDAAAPSEMPTLDADPADAIADAVARLRLGDVVVDDDGERFVVLGVSWRRGGRARVRLVDRHGRDRRWELAELEHTPTTIGHIELPTPPQPEQTLYRDEAASQLRRARLKQSGRDQRRQRRRADDPRVELQRAERRASELERRARADEKSIARRFDAIAAVLEERGHLDQWTPTVSGHVLTRVYHELDLAVTDALTAGHLDALDPAPLASLVSCFTYEHRRPTPPPAPWFPSPDAGDRFRRIEREVIDLQRIETRNGVTPTRNLEAGFAPLAHAWAAGEDLATLLATTDDDVSPGDFVRNVKQLIDVLRQIAAVSPTTATRRSAGIAADALHRGVVALSGAVEAAT